MKKVLVGAVVTGGVIATGLRLKLAFAELKC
jgi:hypothetical protein